MTDELTQKWNARYQDADPAASRPCEVLKTFAYLLPPEGRALDLACGLGGNACLMAGHGLETSAWDVSPVAIDRLRAHAESENLPIEAKVRDVQKEPPESDAFDVIVVAYFLERDLAAAIEQALKPGGLLFYQTWTREAVDDRGPGNPAFRLAPNELLRLFPGLRVVSYREEGLFGDPARGLRNEAWLVATRP